MPLTEKIAYIREDIANAALRAGRDPSGITLVAVTKTRTVDEIRDAVAAGIGHIGENRIQEAAAKLPQVSGNVVKHMIGHVQSNKGRAAADLFDWVDSVDSKKITDILWRETSRPQWVEPEYILELAREAFLSLLGTHKTYDREVHILKTGNP